jgi:excisionase family DNA binding protein
MITRVNQLPNLIAAATCCTVTDVSKRKKDDQPPLGDAVIDKTTPPRSTYQPRVADRPMNAKEIAAFLQVSPATIRRKIARGEIPFFRVGRQFRFLPGEVLQRLRHKPSDDE